MQQFECNSDLTTLLNWCIKQTQIQNKYVARSKGVNRGAFESVLLADNQFTYGRFSSAKELGISPSTLRDRMKRLEKYGLISITPIRTSAYSVVTVHRSA
jgi:hypothetical protein